MSTFIYTAERQAHQVRIRYLRAVLRQNISWFDLNEGAGAVATRITSDTLAIQDGIGEKVPLSINYAATFVSGFIIAFIKSWELTLVLLSVIPLMGGAAFVMGTVNGKFQTLISQVYSEAGNYAEETLSSVRTVIAFGAQKKMSRRYDNALKSARKVGIRKSVTMGLGLGFMFFFMYLAYSLAFYYGSRMLYNNKIESGTIVNVFFAIIIGAFAIGQIAPDLAAFTAARGAAYAVFNTIDRIPEIDSLHMQGTMIPESEFQGSVRVKNVSFVYPARPDVSVLNGISLDIEAGTTVALVGQSGSGKSTIIQLLERFYDPTEGSLEIDGVGVKDLNLSWLRSHLGYVQQEPVLFEGTVFDNVAHGLIGSSRLSNLSKEEKLKKVKDACRQANAHEFITKLPQGYDTPVGERGLLLSGGQKQRVILNA